jgi:predicted kinase
MKEGKNIFIMVGNIASGKSTHLEEVKATDPNIVIISKDDIRKMFAKSINKDYIWNEDLEEIINIITIGTFGGYCHIGTQNIYIDETNMTKRDREVFINIARDCDYKITVVIFPDLGEDIHVERRLSNNHGDMSEETWRRVYREKKDKYEEPTYDEGFDYIIYIGDNNERN